MICIGDLVVDACDDLRDTGIVVKINTNVEVPPIITVLWSAGSLSKATRDDLKIVSCKSENRKDLLCLR